MSEELDMEIRKLNESIDRDPKMKETKVSEWIRKNKALIIAGSGLTASGAKAIAWIVEHVEDIKNFIETVSKVFPSETQVATLDFDSLHLGQEDLMTALDNDPVLISKVLVILKDKHQFETTFSKKYNLSKLGIFV